MKETGMFFICMAALYSANVWCGSTNVLLGKNFCIEDRTLCVKGSIDYDYSKGKLLLHGRVGQTRKKGILYIALEGSVKNKKIKTLVPVKIRGRSFDIVKSEKKVKTKNRHIKWRLKEVYFKK